MYKKLGFIVALGVGVISANAASVVIPMYLTGESQVLVGMVSATDTKYGLMLIPRLNGLTPVLPAGVHGFHVHENHSCADAGMASGGHLDPRRTKRHLGPYNSKGHLGDLPVIYVNADGTVNIPIIAPRLKVRDILNHSLMIHNGGDNYLDEPQPLGGGGARMACGVVPVKAGV